MSMDRIIEKKKWTAKKIASIIVLSIFFLFLVYLTFLRDKQSRLYVDKSQITIAVVTQDKFQEFIPIDGIVFPKTTVYIDAVQGGVVEDIYVEDGSLLEPGDPILKLKNASMELSYMDQETRMYDAINNLQNTQIALEQNKFYRQQEIVRINFEKEKAGTDFERKKQLFEEKVISLKEFEDAERDYNFTIKQKDIALRLQRLDSISAENQTRQIDVSVKRMYSNLEMLRQNLENMTIKAPVRGTLSSFNAEIGETKTAGARLGQIDLMEGFKMTANIDERYISRVNIGQEAEFDFAGNTYYLTVNKIYTDVTNGSFQVDLMFTDNEPEGIKRGQTLQLKLKFSSPSDAIIIKRGGFYQTTGGNWVYVVDRSGGYAYKRNISIGRQNTRYYEVLEGLQPGEEVVVSSYENFGNKDKLVFK